MRHQPILGVLLEGFAAAPAGPQVLDGRLRPGDRVSVPVKGSDRIVGRVVRPSDSKPASHVIVAPEGGGPHVEASVKSARHDTPEQHGREREKRRAEFEAQGPPGMPGKGQPAQAQPGKPGAVQESVLGELLESFAAAPAPPLAPASVPPASETPAQSRVRGAASVVAARKELASVAAWNASKHPRGAGGKFSYTSGGKRAHVGSSRSLSTKGYGNYVGVGARGALVKSVQRQLGIRSDGVYGQQTRAAIMRFQTNHGLRVDGVIGRQTLAALRGQKAAKIAPGPIGTKVARVVKHRPRVPVRVAGGVRIG